MKNNDILEMYKKIALKKSILTKENTEVTDHSIKRELILINTRMNNFEKALREDSYEKIINNDELEHISLKLGRCEELSYSCENEEIKKEIINVAKKYRTLTNAYMSKSFEYLNNQIDSQINMLKENSENSIKKINENTKDIIGNQIFSIASIFLGISLTSAIVAGVGKIPPEFLILYFLTAGMIAIDIIGISSILIRKIDWKSITILIISLLVTIAWGYCAHKTYQSYEIINQKEIVEVEKNND